MFRMYGRKVEILRYQIDYVESNPVEEEEARNITVYAPTEEEANALAEMYGGTVTPLEIEDDAWMDGIEVDDVPNTRGAALEIYQMGEEAYLAMKANPTDEQRIVALESALVALMKMNMNMGE